MKCIRGAKEGVDQPPLNKSKILPASCRSKMRYQTDIIRFTTRQFTSENDKRNQKIGYLHAVCKDSWF